MDNEAYYIKLTKKMEEKMRTIFSKDTTVEEMEKFFNKFVKKGIMRILPLSEGQTIVDFE